MQKCIKQKNITFVPKDVLINLKRNQKNMFKTNSKKIAIFAVVIVLVGGYFFVSGKTSSSKSVGGDKIQATLYKSPSCGCCLGHASYLKSEGFDVETVVEGKIESIKEKHNIPYDMQSCHTTEVDGYFVEGHVSIEAVNKLLAERPDIDGITLSLRVL